MSEIEKIKEIYNSNIILPSKNNICGIVTEDKTAYQCSSNKYCNYGDKKVGICENINCLPYSINNININNSKFDGNDVYRNKTTSICNRSISTDGKCGINNNNTKCPQGKCCSKKGICGYDKESCIYIAPRYENINGYYDNVIKKVNSEYYSKYEDVENFQDEFIKKIGNKYIGNNNFEISNNNNCGLDFDNEKILKCPDNKYCDYVNKCSDDYNNYSIYNTIYLNVPDLSLNLIHGNKFKEVYNKWFNNKEKIQLVTNKYINNKFEISTDGICGIDLNNEKIIKCLDNEYCDVNNKCSIDYDNFESFDFNSKSLKDLSSNTIYYNDIIGFKDLSSNIMHGNNFYKEYNEYNKFKLKNNEFITNSLDSSYNEFEFMLDCNDSDVLDSFKIFFYNETGKNSKIVDIIKINKIDNKTCDIKYNFEGIFSGQNTRRVTFQYKPDIGYVCIHIGNEMSGSTLNTQLLDSNNTVSDTKVDNVSDPKVDNSNKNTLLPFIIAFIVICIFLAIGFFIYNK